MGDEDRSDGAADPQLPSGTPAGLEPAESDSSGCLSCAGTLVLIALCWSAIRYSDLSWLQILGLVVVVLVVVGAVAVLIDEKDPAERRKLAKGFALLPFIVLLGALAWDSIADGGDAPEGGGDTRCADISDRWNDGAGTLSNGNATDDEVRWAMENGCPGW